MQHAAPIEKYMVVTLYGDYEEGNVTHDTLKKARADYDRQRAEHHTVYLCKIMERSG